MPPEHDADAVARGDVLLDDDAQTTETPDEAASPPAAAAPAGEETPSSAAEDDALQDGAAPSAKEDEDKEPRIPKTRFDQAVQRERERAAAAEAELKKYRDRAAQQAQAANFEESQKKVKELLKEHSSLLADGDLDKASDVMEQVLQLRDDMTQARAQALAENTRNSTKNEIRYDATVTRLEAEYPEINPDSESFDEQAVRRVQMMVTGIMQSEGKDAATALQEATDILLKPAKEAKGALREKPSEEAAEAGLRRRQQQIDKNVDAAAKQPPSTAEVGADHDAAGGGVDAAAIAKMSWEEFLKVPDDELAKMRGDYIN
jgi:hypothetical protein